MLWIVNFLVFLHLNLFLFHVNNQCSTIITIKIDISTYLSLKAPIGRGISGLGTFSPRPNQDDFVSLQVKNSPSFVMVP